MWTGWSMPKLDFSIRAVSLLVLLVLSTPGCILVGGYSSEGGFWIWPGTVVLLSIGVALILLIRRRR